MVYFFASEHIYQALLKVGPSFYVYQLCYILLDNRCAILHKDCPLQSFIEKRKHTHSHTLSSVLYRDFTDCSISEIMLWGQVNSQTESLAFHTFWFLCLCWQKCKHRVENESWNPPFSRESSQISVSETRHFLRCRIVCVKHYYISVSSAESA